MTQMHCKFSKYIENEYIDIEQYLQWMKHTVLKGETKGFIASKAEALNTRY